MGEAILYRIGELASLAQISPRTIHYYTSIGLIEPVKRSEGNYRLYTNETLIKLERIEQLKKNKLSLEEIKAVLNNWNLITEEQRVSQRLAEIQLQLSKLEREVKELEPVIQQMKPRQARRLYTRLMPQTAACIEALMILMNKSSLM